MTTDAVRPLRADARRNREAVIAAATEAFGTTGVDTPLEEIAAAAGVGIGTLYRHFANRDAVIEAVYRASFSDLCDDVEARLATEPPDLVLAAWMHRLVDHVVLKKGMAQALKAAAGANSELFTEVRQRLNDTIQAMLDAGAAAGTLRTDIQPADLLRAISGICQAGDQPAWREQADRLIDLFMDGMRRTA